MAHKQGKSKNGIINVVVVSSEYNALTNKPDKACSISRWGTKAASIDDLHTTRAKKIKTERFQRGSLQSSLSCMFFLLRHLLIEYQGHCFPRGRSMVIISVPSLSLYQGLGPQGEAHMSVMMCVCIRVRVSGLSKAIMVNQETYHRIVDR